MGISSGLGGTVGAVPAGAVMPFAGANAPAGWLLCAGQAISRTQYVELFLTLGTTYGVGDGSTTFNLPDLRGRVVAGVDNMGGSAASRLTSGNSGITATSVGASGGDEKLHQHLHSNTLSNNTVSSAGHQHAETLMHSTSTGGNGISAYMPWNDPVWGIRGVLRTFANRQGISMLGAEGANATGYPHLTSQDTLITSATTVSISNANAGSGSSQNVQPTMVLNYIIKA